MAKTRKAGANKKPRWWLWLSLAAMIAVLDQYTKTLILGYYQLGDSTTVTSFFNITRHHNAGAAFSLLADAGGWQRWFFLAIGLLAVVLILYFLSKHAGEKLFSFALACILGGAIGNLVDRSMHGYVVDFLDFHFKWLAPAFHQAAIDLEPRVLHQRIPLVFGSRLEVERIESHHILDEDEIEQAAE